ncbi:hypothetical protein VTI74DRAFT_7510 [Chaetomium olivicolor]
MTAAIPNRRFVALLVSGIAEATKSQEANGWRHVNHIIGSLFLSADTPTRDTKTAANEFDTAAEGMKEMLRQLQLNLDEMRKKVAELDANIDKLETEKRGRILNLAVDLLALVFATGPCRLQVFAERVLEPPMKPRVNGGNLVPAQSMTMVVDSPTENDLQFGQESDKFPRLWGLRPLIGTEEEKVDNPLLEPENRLPGSGLASSPKGAELDAPSAKEG